VTLLKDCIEMITKGIEMSLKLLQSKFDDQHNYQVFFACLDEAHLKPGINSAHFSLKSNPAQLANIVTNDLRYYRFDTVYFIAALFITIFLFSETFCSPMRLSH
jgi:hypothetical protein